MSEQLENEEIPIITVDELAVRLQQDLEGLQLLDVREPKEVAIAAIDGFENLPLSQFAAWSEQMDTRFDPEAETLVMCHHGIRSAQMCYWLRSVGFTNVKNIAGGIDAYSQRVDPAVPRY